MKRPVAIALDQIGTRKLPALTKNSKFSLAIPMPSIGSTNNPIDIASDYAWALYAAELLAPHVTALSRRDSMIGYAHYENLRFVPRDLKGCLAALSRIRLTFDEEQPPESEEARIECLEFEATLADSPKVCLHELGDSYLANFVHGLEATFDDSELVRWLRDHPTWRYYFWKSFLSPEVGADVYASTDAWILPRKFEIRNLLRYLGWKSTRASPRFQGAKPIRIGSLPWILANESTCVRVPAEQLNAAAGCWQNALNIATPAIQQSGFADTSDDYLAGHAELDWSVSEDGSIVTVGVADVQFLAFLEPSSKVRPEELRSYLLATEDSHALLSAHCGLPKHPLAWQQLTPERFEELCYDTLIRCERFDPARMRKLGRARARDGGRDIEAWTMARPGKPAQKWIYQCKFSSIGSRSLAGSMVAVSDVVDQYGADGFGVITNLVIDSTLYDKLDGIADTRARAGRSLLVDTWSVYELERFLYPKRDLLVRYFGRPLPEDPDHTRTLPTSRRRSARSRNSMQ